MCSYRQPHVRTCANNRWNKEESDTLVVGGRGSPCWWYMKWVQHAQHAGRRAERIASITTRTRATTMCIIKAAAPSGILDARRGRGGEHDRRSRGGCRGWNLRRYQAGGEGGSSAMPSSNRSHSRQQNLRSLELPPLCKIKNNEMLLLGYRHEQTNQNRATCEGRVQRRNTNPCYFTHTQPQRCNVKTRCARLRPVQNADTY